MCGVAGFIAKKANAELTQTIERMTATLISRGPDSSGIWVDSQSFIALGHRRLSVLELSEAGHQPMHSSCGRYVIIFNGEIYNHLALRAVLERAGAYTNWRGHSDTETLLVCFSAWGIERTLQACVGMFAIVLWDKQRKLITLARDRMGEKPLYWGFSGASFLFASELKAFKKFPDFKPEIDRDVLTLFLRYGYVPAPFSIYKHIWKLLPGHYITVDANKYDIDCIPSSIPYWHFNSVVEHGIACPIFGSDEEVIDAIERQLKISISEQMISDVPLGAFLSGGIDSSLVVALMQELSIKPVRTFTIGFDDKAFNEAGYAKEVANYLGTQHTELYIHAQDALDSIPTLSSVYCEPFSDNSQIPTLLISKLAKQHVTVALTGDGGDELFGGYNTYQLVPALWRGIDKLPVSSRKLISAFLRNCSVSEKGRKLSEIIDSSNKELFYSGFISHWKKPSDLAVFADEPLCMLNDPRMYPETDCFQHWIMAMDAKTYMQDDILVKVDRAAMANSLETRVPMLDYRLFELAWRLPLTYKIRNGKGKWVLREMLARRLPRQMIERRKQGFSIPIADWLRGPLRDWAEYLLNETRLLQEGYFNPAPVRSAWHNHINKKRDESTKLWTILMFQSWLDCS